MVEDIDSKLRKAFGIIKPNTMQKLIWKEAQKEAVLQLLNDLNEQLSEVNTHDGIGWYDWEDIKDTYIASYTKKEKK